MGKVNRALRTIRVSERGLGIVIDHLAQFGHVPENTAMIARLQRALVAGHTITGADANFYLHEISEATTMRRGLSYVEAHLGALAKYGVSPYSLYHPHVIRALPEHFNDAWRRFWGSG